MLETTLSSISGLPSFFAYMGVALALVAIFVRVYTWVTPHDELTLICANNSAAALAFTGALIGFALPLSSAIVHSLTLWDCAIWGLIALVVQIFTFLALRILIKNLSQRITHGEIAIGILVAAVALCMGHLNAACISY